MAKTPYLDLTELTAIAADSGYSQTVYMSQLTNLILLSGLHVLKMRWIWEAAISPITDTQWEVILETLETSESQLMTNFAIGNIFASIASLTTDNVLLLDGSTVLQSDYPDLTSVVPASWLSGLTIQLPDMAETFLQGVNVPAELGTKLGENEVTLTVNEMPIHTHVQNPHSHTYTAPIVTPITAGIEPVIGSLTTPTPALTSIETATNQNSGNSDPHNNVPLSLQTYWYIIAR